MKNTKLETARMGKRLTQEQLALRVGISLRGYKTYEAGERIPRADVAIRIAGALDSTVEALFGAKEQAKRTAKGEKSQ